MIMKAGEEFYRSKERVGKKLEENMRNRFLKQNVQFEYGPPQIIDNNTAGNWLMANYTYATNFHPTGNPAIGEISAFIYHGKESKRLAIPGKCFHDIQEIFSYLREIEKEYLTEFALPFNMESPFFNRAEIPRYTFTLDLSEKVLEFLDKCREIYPGGIGDTFPQLIDGVWKITAPSIEENIAWISEEEKAYPTSIHTHVATNHWTSAILSPLDIGEIMTRDKIKGIRIAESEDYVMSIPLGTLKEIQKLFKKEYVTDLKEKRKIMQKDVSYLDQPIENDLIGLRFLWVPETQKLETSPVLSEVHYNSLKGKIPEGIEMGFGGCYLMGAKDKRKVDLVYFKK